MMKYPYPNENCSMNSIYSYFIYGLDTSIFDLYPLLLHFAFFIYVYIISFILYMIIYDYMAYMILWLFNSIISVIFLLFDVLI